MTRSKVRCAVVGVTIAFWFPAAEAGFFDNSAMEPNDYVDTSKPWEEQILPLPGLPRDEDLLRIEVESASANDDFIDRKTLEVAQDAITRVTLVSRHKSGTQTVTREGIRCKTGEYRIYGIVSNGAWTVPKNSVWRSIRAGGYHTLRSVLFESILCKDGFPKTPERAIKDVIYPPVERNW